MSNPFKNVPLNNRRIFVVVKSNGCKVYVPVDSNDSEVVATTRIRWKLVRYKYTTTTKTISVKR